MTLQTILQRQRIWAESRWPSFVGDRLPSLNHSLFQPLSEETVKEFGKGSGDELGIKSNKPRMVSLRSSSALVCNFFDPWRGSNLSPLTAALGFDDEFVDLRFEEKCPHGLRSTPPNLDVLLTRKNGGPIGVESKFAEPYGRHRDRPPLDDKYFASDRQRWKEQGLAQCQQLARAVGSSERYTRLDAGQLLKHILGLARRFKPSAVTLLYLWYDVGGREAGEHRAELARFEQAIDPCVDFRALTYQHAFGRLETAGEPRSGYLAYLRARYFAA